VIVIFFVGKAVETGPALPLLPEQAVTDIKVSSADAEPTVSLCIDLT
jgi:hypothetical protein